MKRKLERKEKLGIAASCLIWALVIFEIVMEVIR